MESYVLKSKQRRDQLNKIIGKQVGFRKSNLMLDRANVGNSGTGEFVLTDDSIFVGGERFGGTTVFPSIWWSGKKDLSSSVTDKPSWIPENTSLKDFVHNSFGAIKGLDTLKHQGTKITDEDDNVIRTSEGTFVDIVGKTDKSGNFLEKLVSLSAGEFLQVKEKFNLISSDGSIITLDSPDAVFNRVVIDPSGLVVKPAYIINRAQNMYGNNTGIQERSDGLWFFYNENVQGQLFAEKTADGYKLVEDKIQVPLSGYEYCRYRGIWTVEDFVNNSEDFAFYKMFFSDYNNFGTGTTTPDSPDTPDTPDTPTDNVSTCPLDDEYIQRNFGGWTVTNPNFDADMDKTTIETTTISDLKEKTTGEILLMLLTANSIEKWSEPEWDKVTFSASPTLVEYGDGTTTVTISGGTVTAKSDRNNTHTFIAEFRPSTFDVDNSKDTSITVNYTFNPEDVPIEQTQNISGNTVIVLPRETKTGTKTLTIKAVKPVYYGTDLNNLTKCTLQTSKTYTITNLGPCNQAEETYQYLKVPSTIETYAEYNPDTKQYVTASLVGWSYESSDGYYLYKYSGNRKGANIQITLN